jgi:IS30 family transposase
MYLVRAWKSMSGPGQKPAAGKGTRVAMDVMTTNIQLSFCDPQRAWQRGSNEDTNALLRQYFPRGTDLSVYSQTHLIEWLGS